MIFFFWVKRSHEFTHESPMNLTTFRFRKPKKKPEVFFNNASNAYPQISLILFVCLFVWGLSSYSRIFHLYGDAIIASGRVHIFNSARHSWPFSSEGSSACHTYCVNVYNGHLRGPVKLAPIAERLAVELSLTVFSTNVCRGWDSNTQPSACGENALTRCATAVECNFLLQCM